jgi:hypothetical protein
MQRSVPVIASNTLNKSFSSTCRHPLSRNPSVASVPASRTHRTILPSPLRALLPFHSHLLSNLRSCLSDENLFTRFADGVNARMNRWDLARPSRVSPDSESMQQRGLVASGSVSIGSVAACQTHHQTVYAMAINLLMCVRLMTNMNGDL